jgi:pyridoxamine-phosphate oxidase
MKFFRRVMSKWSIRKKIAQIRRDYRQEGLLEENVLPDPIGQFELWFNEALKVESLDANAMTLSTATKDGRPSARVVLLKGFDDSGFVFYTNYESRKAEEISENPFATLSFYWPVLIRQVRIEGILEKVSKQKSETYFHSRPFATQIAAAISPQSHKIATREELEQRYDDLKAKTEGRQIPLPTFWGGYRLKPDRIEFWQGRPIRLHDRLLYTREESGWRIDRLAP